MEDYGIQHLISNKEKETCIAKISRKGKGEECPGSELLHTSKCSKFHGCIFKCVKEHHKAQLLKYKEKHKPEHEPKVHSELSPDN